MLQTRIYLECDECGNPFPGYGNLPAVVDGALYTARQLRQKAAQEKEWTRDIHTLPAGVKGRLDLCRRCSQKRAKKGGR